MLQKWVSQNFVLVMVQKDLTSIMVLEKRWNRLVFKGIQDKPAPEYENIIMKLPERITKLLSELEIKKTSPVFTYLFLGAPNLITDKLTLNEVLDKEEIRNRLYHKAKITFFPKLSSVDFSFRYKKTLDNKHEQDSFLVSMMSQKNIEQIVTKFEKSDYQLAGVFPCSTQVRQQFEIWQEDRDEQNPKSAKSKFWREPVLNLMDLGNELNHLPPGKLHEYEFSVGTNLFRKLLISGLAVALVVCLTGGVVALMLRSTNTHYDQLQSKTNDSIHRLDSLKTLISEKKTALDSELWKAQFASKNSWILSQLEHQLPPTVAFDELSLLYISRRGVKGTIRGKVKKDVELYDFLQALDTSSFIDRVSLQSINRRDNTTSLFTLTFAPK